jgi:hypothetical protein
MQNIRQKLETFDVSELWHITHWENIKNIFNLGILNHYDAYERVHNVKNISDPGAQRWRNNIEPIYNRKIHDYAPLYIHPYNPMFYVRREIINELCLVEVSLDVLVEGNFLISDGNAASKDTRFSNSIDFLDDLSWDCIYAKYWKGYEDGKRKKCAEILVYPSIEPNYIEDVYCYSEKTEQKLFSQGYNAKILIEPF